MSAHTHVLSSFPDVTTWSFSQSLYSGILLCWLLLMLGEFITLLSVYLYAEDVVVVVVEVVVVVVMVVVVYAAYGTVITFYKFLHFV